MSQNTNIKTTTQTGLSENKKKIRHTTIIELGLLGVAVVAAVAVAVLQKKD